MGEENLGGTTYVTVVIRVVVDRKKGSVHGDLVDLEGASVRHFVGWRGLVRAVKSWLDRHIEAPPAAALPEHDV